MNDEKYNIIEYKLNKIDSFIFTNLINQITDTEQMSYVLTRLTQDYLRMTHFHLTKNMPSQEAKAAMKVILDTVLMSYGMHVRIDEFEKPAS